MTSRSVFLEKSGEFFSVLQKYDFEAAWLPANIFLRSIQLHISLALAAGIRASVFFDDIGGTNLEEGEFHYGAVVGGHDRFWRDQLSQG